MRRAQIFERLERWDLFERLPDRESPIQSQINAMEAKPIGMECIVEEYEKGDVDNFQQWSCEVCFTTSNIHKQLMPHLESVKHSINYLVF